MLTTLGVLEKLLVTQTDGTYYICLCPTDLFLYTAVITAY